MKGNVLEISDISAMLGIRKRDANKGDNGHGLLLAGSREMPGAACMAAAAALRGGIGTLKVMCPEAARETLSRLPEAMVLPIPGSGWAALEEAFLLRELFHATALAIGPGIGREAETDRVLLWLLAAKKPTVIDADGLFALSRLENKSSVLHENVILTPHFGEMARLCGCTVSKVKEKQGSLAREKAEEWGCTVLLKGPESVIAGPDGSYAWNVTGNAGLAKGGSGDVLAGIALAMLGQRLPPFDAACCAAYLLGTSADEALALLRERMLMARDVTEMIAFTLENSVYRPK
ncbi:MAG: NAD(P)H-hydrate dehydratase [Clostridiales bacterium]|nr:NAD(P)H-hydrate dehydratase [Clostridiales bacterium]